jgi:hypothetical protein
MQQKQEPNESDERNQVHCMLIVGLCIVWMGSGVRVGGYHENDLEQEGDGLKEMRCNHWRKIPNHQNLH